MSETKVPPGSSNFIPEEVIVSSSLPPTPPGEEEEGPTKATELERGSSRVKGGTSKPRRVRSYRWKGTLVELIAGLESGEPIALIPDGELWSWDDLGGDR